MILKAVNIFTRGPSWMYEWALNTPLKGFVQDAPREELATAPVVECLTATLGKTTTKPIN